MPKSNITIKYVRKAKQWVKTTKLPGDVKHHQKFKQEWSDTKPNEN